MTPRNPADRPATEPRTDAGRALLMGDPIAGGSYRIPHLDTCIWWKVGGRCDGDCGVLPAILAIEAEARATPPSYHANPNHLRSHCLVCTPGIPPYPDGVIAEEPTDEECACGDPKYPDAYCPRHGA